MTAVHLLAGGGSARRLGPPQDERRDLLERDRLPPSRTAAAPSSPGTISYGNFAQLLHHGRAWPRPTSRFAPETVCLGFVRSCAREVAHDDPVAGVQRHDRRDRGVTLARGDHVRPAVLHDRRARVRRAEVDADDRAGGAGDRLRRGGQAEVDARRAGGDLLDAVGRGEVRLRGRGRGGRAAIGAGARVDAGVPSGRAAMGAGATTPGDAAALLQLHHPLDERARGVVEPRELDAHPGRATRMGARILRLDQRTTPAPRIAASPPASLSSRWSSVPTGLGSRVRMKTPPREMFTAKRSTSSSMRSVGEPDRQPNRRPRPAALVVRPLHGARLSLRGGRRASGAKRAARSA